MQNKYYSKYDIDYWFFKNMRNELIKSKNWTEVTKMFWVPPKNWLKKKAPICYNWIEAVREYDIEFIRFHLTPPKGKLNIHVDGTLEKPRVYALNIPILNYENSLMKWYDFSDKTNWKNDYVEPREKLSNAKGGVPIDESKCVIIEQTVIDKPTFLRTDIPHSIDNPNDGTRIILSVRFNYSQ